ncbi:MAG: hypothetical protein INR64_03895 [Caulobacteraceae bacterium]|nr:hypothetical protein [Caulobacter sp.]
MVSGSGRLWCLGLAAVALAAPASAAPPDPQALAPNYPVEIEDALPVPLGAFTVQLDQRLTRDRTGGTTADLGQPEAVLKLGAAKGLQLDLSSSYSYGSADQVDNGFATVDALYQATTDHGLVPDLAVHAYYQAGYGHGGPSDQTVLRGLATKRLGADDQAPRLHLNLTWTHVLTPGATSRDDQYSVGVGYSMLLLRDTALVVDYVHSQGADRHTPFDNLVDLGVIHQFSSAWSVAAGAGGGVSASSPEGRVFVGLQRSFKLFGS